MIDIPLNKALVAVEQDGYGCSLDCVMYEACSRVTPNTVNWTVCQAALRKDGRNVIFKLIDLPEEKGGAL